MTSLERGDPSAHSVLFITRRHIGDAVMTTPVLEVLHQRHPSARIDILAGPQSAALFEHCPYRGQIWRMARQASVWERLTLIRELRRQRYELIVDLRTDGLAYLLRARKRRTRWEAGDRKRLPHDVERQAAIFDPALTRTALGTPKIWLSTEIQDRARLHLSRLPGARWLALAPGANWEPKCWPVDRFVEMTHAVPAEFDGFLLLGGPDDAERARVLAAQIRGPCLNLAGETDLLLAAAVLAQASAFVGNDSGLGHLASAVGTPSLTVFGPGEPERFHPWGPKANWIIAPGRDLSQLSGARVAEGLRAHLARLQLTPEPKPA